MPSQRFSTLPPARRHGAPHCFGNDVDLVDVPINHRPAWQRLDGIALEAQRALAGLGQLDDLHARRADIEADQRRRFRRKRQIKGQGDAPSRRRLNQCSTALVNYQDKAKKRTPSLDPPKIPSRPDRNPFFLMFRAFTADLLDATRNPINIRKPHKPRVRPNRALFEG